ncbi:MAG: hypothetical protein ACE5JL_07915 [Dehalococcoidia bacterium]
MLREVPIYILPTLLYSVTTILLTHPMMGKWADHLFGDGDSYFLPWVLAWVFHAARHSPSTFFHANIFYPAPNSLAFSEHHLSAQLLFAPVYYVSDNPVLAYNLVLLLSFVLSGLTMFALVRDLTRDTMAALVSGFVFAFAPVHFVYYPHLQILLIWWSPLALLFLERYIRRRSWRNFILFSGMFWLQCLSSVYFGLYLATMAFFRLLYAAWRDRDLIWSRQMAVRGAFLAVGTAAVLTPVVLPYFQVSRQWQYTRTLGENIGSSAQLTSYLNAFPGNYLYGDLLSNFSYLGWPKYLFTGFLPIALALLGVWAVFRRSDHVPKSLVGAGRVYLILGAAALVLSLGPFFTWRGQVTSMPLPYIIFYYLAPGYQAMRIPARFGLWVGLTLSVLAGVGYHWLRKEIASRFLRRELLRFVQGATIVLVLVTLAMESYTPFSPNPVPVNEKIPAVYRFLATEDDRSPLIELPVPKRMDVIHWQEAKRTYYSIYHRRPMVNGYSGFIPPSFEEIVTLANDGPRLHVIKALAALGVRTIVLHLGEMSDPERLAWQQVDSSSLGLQEIARFGTDKVLKIMAEPDPEATLRAVLDPPQNAPAGEHLRMGLRLSSTSEQPWVDRQLRRRVDVEVRWRNVATGQTVRGRSTISIPLFVFRDDPTRVGLSVTSPATAGIYEVTVSSALFTAAKLVEIVAL